MTCYSPTPTHSCHRGLPMSSWAARVIVGCPCRPGLPVSSWVAHVVLGCPCHRGLVGCPCRPGLPVSSWVGGLPMSSWAARVIVGCPVPPPTSDIGNPPNTHTQVVTWQPSSPTPTHRTRPHAWNLAEHQNNSSQTSYREAFIFHF